MFYTLGVDQVPFILCSSCGLKSYHPKDISLRYCGLCRIFLSPEVEKKQERTLTLREALLLLLDQIDYTTGACRVTSLVGAVLEPNVLALVKAALAKDMEERSA